MQERLIYLYERWLTKTASEAERQELLALLETIDLEQELAPLMKAAWDKTKEEEGLFTAGQKSKLANVILLNASPHKEAVAPVRPINSFTRKWFRYAATVTLLLGIAAVYYFSLNKQPDNNSIASTLVHASGVLPGGERAILTLADGTEIVLDSAGNGMLAQQGNTKVVKLANGQIAYDINGNAQMEMLNTMRTPRGGLYQLNLPDGSRVWLNAASAITFPAAFVGKERKVKVSGEAYFEVAKDKLKPFLVEIDGESLVEVLGTSFNINAYRDDESIRSTLVTGSIKVSSIKSGNQQAGATILKPGETLVDGKIAAIDISRVLAWKNGIFDFTGKSFQALMKDVERWYDIQVQYQGAIPDFKLKGEMDRGVQLEDLMKFLQQYGLNIRLEGRKLIIAEKI